MNQFIFDVAILMFTIVIFQIFPQYFETVTAYYNLEKKKLEVEIDILKQRKEKVLICLYQNLRKLFCFVGCCRHGCEMCCWNKNYFELYFSADYPN